jgi:hypothetical protein
MILTWGTGGLLVEDVTGGLSRQRLVQRYPLAESGGAAAGVEPDLAAAGGGGAEALAGQG